MQAVLENNRLSMITDIFYLSPLNSLFTGQRQITEYVGRCNLGKEVLACRGKHNVPSSVYWVNSRIRSYISFTSGRSGIWGEGQKKKNKKGEGSKRM